MGWSDAIAAAATLGSKVIHLIWGGQSFGQRSLEDRAEQAAREKHAALARLDQAQNEGDGHAAHVALDDVNRWSAELQRLRDEAAAKRAG